MEKRRRLVMERSKVEGRMGRKADSGRLDRLKKLRSVGMSVQEITKLCNISRSTYYREMAKGKN